MSMQLWSVFCLEYNEIRLLILQLSVNYTVVDKDIHRISLVCQYECMKLFVDDAACIRKVCQAQTRQCRPLTPASRARSFELACRPIPGTIPAVCTKPCSLSRSDMCMHTP